MRNMSFALTTAQLLNGSKTVTRRLGWRFLKRGERVEGLCVIRVKSIESEPLFDAHFYQGHEPKREGFPDLTSYEFVEMFCKHMKCAEDTEVTRIEFEKVRHDKQS